MPGAYRASSSWPKYDWPAPAATMRLSYGISMSCRWAVVAAWTTRRSRSNPVTSATSTRTFSYRRTTWRIGGAIWPGDSMPVATW